MWDLIVSVPDHCLSFCFDDLWNIDNIYFDYFGERYLSKDKATVQPESMRT